MIQVTNKELILQKAQYGNFFTLKTNEKFCDKEFSIGEMVGVKKFTASFRTSSCWMGVKIGTKVSEIPEETQFLMLHDNEKYMLVFPLVDLHTRFSLSGKDELILVGETGDTETEVDEAVALYIIEGDNPLDLIQNAASDIVNKLQTVNLRKNKKTPAFVDFFGFCTFNAFYCDVTHDKIISVLEQFIKNEISLGFLIIDDGWQKTEGNYITSFEPDNSKFPRGLKAVTEEAKIKYGLNKILVWQTLYGYWNGMMVETSPDIEIEETSFKIPERHIRLNRNRLSNAGDATAGDNFYPTSVTGLPVYMPKNDFFRFYFDFFSYLRKQGVDGVKIDAMSWMEYFGEGKGGRVRRMQELVSSVEASSSLNFDGEHINCSSCSNDFLYNTLASNVTRSSTDYYPETPSSHGAHILVNAHTSFWMGEFILPDWDMFQSGNTAGEYHAMSRSIYGGPIYCTDELSKQNFEIIHRLTTKHGLVGRCIRPATATIDSFFIDPEKDFVPIKIQNENKFGYVIGAFNCTYDKNENKLVKGLASVNDIHNLKGEKFAVYSYKKGFIGIFSVNEYWEITLSQFEGDIYSICPVKNGYAVIGMTEKYNPTAFVTKISDSGSLLEIDLLEPGQLCIYTEKEPQSVPYQHTYENNILIINADEASAVIKL